MLYLGFRAGMTRGLVTEAEQEPEHNGESQAWGPAQGGCRIHVAQVRVAAGHRSCLPNAIHIGWLALGGA